MIYFLNSYFAILAVIKITLSGGYFSASRKLLVIIFLLTFVAALNVVITASTEALIVSVYLSFFLLISREVQHGLRPLSYFLFLIFIPFSLHVHKISPFYFEKSEFVFLVNILFLCTTRIYNNTIFTGAFIILNVFLSYIVLSSFPLLVVLSFIVVTFITNQRAFLAFLGIVCFALMFNEFELVKIMGVVGVFSEDLYRFYSNLVPLKCFELSSMLGLWSNYKECGVDYLQDAGISAEVIRKNFVIQTGSPQGLLFRSFYDLGLVGVIAVIYLFFQLPSVVLTELRSRSHRSMFLALWYVFLFVQHKLVFFPIFLLLFFQRGR